MREILFRGKAINRNKFREYRTNYKNGDWVYGLISKPYCERFPSIPLEMTNTNGISGIDVDYKTIGQYTGLTDKNGRKIFEGDILKLKDYHHERIVYVFWGNIGSWFYGGDGYSDEYIFNSSEKEVIGNVHDNPEMLGGDEK